MTLDLTHLETLLAAATPGPWEADHNCTTFLYSTEFEIGRIESGQDADLIIALRNAAPALIARVRELEEALEEYANPKNWTLRGRFNPCDGGFDGTSFAEKNLR